MPRVRQLSERCREYVTRSLVPSLVLENRLRTAAPNDRTGPLSMKFHSEWRHPDCPVHRWYNQQTGSTRLVSIQHRRERRAPYHHEFLLMDLGDGAMCRLERVGEGSRAAAVGRVGCTAHDIVQHFPPQTYSNTQLANESSELIVELDAGGFDLLDVLAVCHGVQQYARSATYTVQRFDSRFLCTVVLVLFARRIADWENRISEDDWRSMVERMISQLHNASTDAHDFFGLVISGFINTDQPRPRSFVLNSIQSRLTASGLQGLRDQVAKTLWHKDLKLAAHASLSNLVSDSVGHALKDSDPCATRVKQLLGTRKGFDSSEDVALCQFRQAVATEQASALLNFMQDYKDAVTAPYAMEASENAVPWMVLIKSSLLTSSFSFTALKHFGVLWEDLISPYNYIAKTRGTIKALPQVMKTTHIRNIKKLMECAAFQGELNYVDDTMRNNATGVVISATHNILQQQANADDYSTRVLVVANSWLNEKIWTRCLAVCVGREIGREVDQMTMSTQLITVQAAQPGQPEARRQISVFRFIEDVQRRIQAHAAETELLGLATATLVRSDIEEAMSEVWKQLPSGFGNGLNADEAEHMVDDQPPPEYRDTIEPANAA
ncbi:hypothetical protein RSOLAG22IIIB_08322 [Rhizoctonia solani]|uniref:Uncharacterized protein n=1 Tax=Rhizoctonia solani TaxID=456999 RepID=A0A0K6FSG6_9AGAM|nr:hypothetical protein RSOLAG22IIIB_08322 [Rhizoctonia solani]